MSVPAPVQLASPSEAVVERVAALEGADPTELEPLFEVIDPEALDMLIESECDPDESDLRIEFTYHGHDVTVTARGTIHIDSAPLS